MDVIETPRLVLRPFRESDADDVFAYARDPRVGPPAGWPPHRSRAESLAVIRDVFSAPGVAALVLKGSGRVVGSVGFEDRHSDRLPGPDNEIGYALSPACWGRGLMSEAVAALVDYGFTAEGLETIWCNHYQGNARSMGVIVKCGFVHQYSRRVAVPLLHTRRLAHFYALTRAQWEKGGARG